MTLRARPAAGFTLMEVLVATGITVAVTVLACGLAVQAQVMWRTDNARVDLQQRLRVAADMLSRDLLEAGAGAQAGASKGPLLRMLAPVIPRRLGLRGADAPAVFRRDAVTVLRVAAGAEPASLMTPAPARATTLEIAPSPLCLRPSCGLAQGASLLLADGTGQFDVFTVTAAAGPVLTVRHQGTGSAAYAAGSPVIAVESATYYWDAPAAALKRYDGDASDLPLVDDVVGMEVEYWGEARPPALPRPPAGAANCLYAADGSYHSALMPVLGDPAALIVFSEDTLTDGPWCGSGGTLFDADLLRIRRLRVLLRLQASDASVRGMEPSLFRRPGSSRAAGTMVPDATAVVDVTPRNLREGW